MKHGSADSMAYPPQPGSPTLTNPDMILPDYDRADSPDDLPEPNILMWNTQPSATLRNQMLPPESFVAGPMTPTTPIIYGNGTMLSDIGEVTEVESNAGGYGARRTSSRYSAQSIEDVAVRSSPTIGVAMVNRIPQKTMRERRSSIESTSTIRSNGNAHFADFDDVVSVDDSNFQGDDEESMASSWVDDNPLQGHVAVQQPVAPRAVEEVYSTSSISQRAEQILANAKRRLTTMEGNLTRARTSLSNSSISNGSTPSPPLTRPRTAMHEAVTTPVASRHVRNKSEDGLHAGAGPTSFPTRSASALGAAGGYRKPSSGRTGDVSGAGVFRGNHLVSHYPLDTALEPLSEDDDGSIADSARDSGQYSNSATPTFGTFSEKHLTRSASAAQMREIQDQMQGLKGKISTLKEQARADSMKRRSLQSLRTPSPFTHARWDHGFGGAQGANDSEPPSPALNGPEDDETTPTETVPPKLPLPEQKVLPESNIAQVDEDKPDPQELHQVAPEDVGQALSPDFEDAPSSPTESMSDAAKEVTQTSEDGVQNDSGEDSSGRADSQTLPDGAEVDSEVSAREKEDNLSDYDSDAGDSLYHDSYQHPVSHEDREDAFDYEHFFLHSAMGNLRNNRRGSTSSIESNESIETARGPDRRSSIDTTASAESFRTADEGRASRTSVSHEETPRASEFDQRPISHRAQHSAYSGFRFGTESTERPDNRPRTNSVIHRPVSAAPAASMHRPSVSSFESTGTTRSFPLVNKARLNGGVLTPQASPDQSVKQTGPFPLPDTPTLHDSGFPSTVSMLAKEDQVLVEGLIAGLGQCVLKLSEGSRASTEGRLNLRRLEAARRILEGLDDV